MARKLMTAHPEWTDKEVAQFLHAHPNTLLGIRRELERSGKIPLTTIRHSREIVVHAPGVSRLAGEVQS